MINLTLLDVTVRRGAYQGALFSVGAALVEFFQAFVALAMLQQLNKVPHLNTVFTMITVPLFIYLGWRHFSAPPAITGAAATPNNRNPFLHGAGISAVNLMAYPYWIVWGNFFLHEGADLSGPTQWALYALFAALGALGCFWSFTLFGNLLARHISQFSSISSKLIGLAFWGLAGYLLFRLF